MKHLALLVIMSLIMYFSWSYLPSKDKKATKRFLSEHLPVVAFIITTILVVLVVQLNLVSIAIL
jgi:hypothetical protein